MKTIALTQGKEAIIDDEDFEWLNQWKWYAYKAPHTYYAGRCIHGDDHQIILPMHRFILGLEPGNKKHVDHVNQNGLDNRRENIRLCSKSQNGMNRGKQKNNISGYKGVSWHKKNKKWHAYININTKRIFLGLFDSKISAAKTYDKAAKKYFGEFACLNFAYT